MIERLELEDNNEKMKQNKNCHVFSQNISENRLESFSCQMEIDEKCWGLTHTRCLKLVTAKEAPTTSSWREMSCAKTRCILLSKALELEENRKKMKNKNKLLCLQDIWHFKIDQKFWCPRQIDRDEKDNFPKIKLNKKIWCSNK